MCRFLKVVILVSAVFSVSCKTGFNAKSDYVIRYMSINAVYEYIERNSNEIQELKRKKDFFQKKINELETATGIKPGNEIAHYKHEILKVEEQERKIKSDAHKRIKEAVITVAARHNADFVLNTGDGVIYSKPVYDITPEVIREIRSAETRSSPEIK